MNKGDVRDATAGFLYYGATAADTAAALSRALGYHVDALDLELVRVFDAEDLIVGVEIARRLEGPGYGSVNLSGLLQLAEARRAVIAAGEDWEDMRPYELLTWHPDYVEGDGLSADDEEALGAQAPSPSFGTLAPAVRAALGSPSR